MDNNYNVLDVIDELMSLGYTEEHAEEVAMYCNYNVPLENMFDNQFPSSKIIEKKEVNYMGGFIGTKIYGFCDGYFGRDDFKDKIILLEGKKWIVCAYLESGIDKVTCVNFDSEEEKEECVKRWSVIESNQNYAYKMI